MQMLDETRDLCIQQAVIAGGSILSIRTSMQQVLDSWWTSRACRREMEETFHNQAHQSLQGSGSTKTQMDSGFVSPSVLSQVEMLSHDWDKASAVDNGTAEYILKQIQSQKNITNNNTR